MLDRLVLSYMVKHIKEASSRVKSPHAFYQPTSLPEPPMLELQNSNTVAASSNVANRVARNNSKKLSLEDLGPAPASIKPSMPITRPPFMPRLTGQ